MRNQEWIALVSLLMVLLALIPQLHLWVVRGRDWNGAYVSPTGDEAIYSAYVNALIDGRARKNDPYAGIDSTSSSPLPESTLSIQFVPSYVIALSARTFHVSASTAFIGLICVSAFLSSLSVYWLLNTVLQDDRKLAATGTLFVLCLGSLAGGSGMFGTLLHLDLSTPTLTFLRRYQPAAAFPLFFVFNTLVWQSLTNPSERRARIYMGFAGLALAVLIFSYLYLWTAAGSWLLCVGLLWFYFRPHDRRRALIVLISIGTVGALALVPYFYIVSQRAPTLDAEQAMVSTRQLDLFRFPEVLGILILVALAVGVWRGRIHATQRRVIYAASLAVLPFVLFNQQVLSGKSMQPHHFEHFIANYAILVAVLVCSGILLKRISPRVLIWSGALFFSWGLFEVGLPSRLASVPTAVTRDQMVPVFLRLKELSLEDGTVTGLRSVGRAQALVYSPNLGITTFLPTWTSQGTLLDMRGLDFGSASPADQREFFYMHLYYSRVNVESLRNVLNDTSRDLPMNFYARSVMFSYDRVISGLNYEFQPIQLDEVERHLQTYQTFLDSFSREQARRRPLTYAIIPASSNFDFANLDRWYERDAGECVGDYILFGLKLRD